MKSFSLSVPFNVLLCLLLSQTVNAQLAPAKTDTSLSNKAFVAWAKQHAFTVQDVDKAIGYNDLQPLKNMIGNARVVGLGEASHGIHELVAFRNRLFKFLVEQCGFTTIVLEAGLAETAQATTFVETGNGVPNQAAKNMTIGNASPENIELMQWMRTYNADPSHKNKLSFYGMDMQIIGFPGDTTSKHAAIDIVLNYLDKVDALAATRFKAALSPYLSRLSMAKYPVLSVQEHDQLSATLDDITTLITRERINYIPKSSKEEYEWAQRVAIAAQQTDRLARVTPHNPPGEIPPSAWMAVNVRDAAMADNVMWILNNRAKGGKVLVYAHNAHVKNAPTEGSVWDAFTQPPNSLGQYLKSALGNDYFILGTSFAPSVIKSQPASIDAALLNAGKPRFIVDLKAAAINPEIKTWLAVKRPIEANVHMFLNMPIGTAFDALLFMDKTSAAK
jgi:erythromycin esterase